MNEFRVFIYDKSGQAKRPWWQLVIKHGDAVLRRVDFNRLVDAYDYANLLGLEVHNERALPLRQRVQHG